ncbi:hypothetical protein [Glutamicibacter creatinolyticus]|uniref:hypothetical protein n=1 Tax=Glutamicibacter creatinolyticus TaxID=162496 RepID=UPI0037BE466F
MKIAKAVLVPTEVNLREQYVSFEELEQACEQVMTEVNQKKHRVTGQVPMDRFTVMEQSPTGPSRSGSSGNRTRKSPGLQRLASDTVPLKWPHI